MPSRVKCKVERFASLWSSRLLRSTCLVAGSQGSHGRGSRVSHLPGDIPRRWRARAAKKNRVLESDAHLRGGRKSCPRTSPLRNLCSLPACSAWAKGVQSSMFGEIVDHKNHVSVAKRLSTALWMKIHRGTYNKDHCANSKDRKFPLPEIYYQILESRRLILLWMNGIDCSFLDFEISGKF